MGLDQWLMKKTSMIGWDDDMKPIHEVIVNKNGNPHHSIKSKRVNSITETVISWRKFNALEGYMYQHYGAGSEPGDHLFLDKDDIVKLLDIARSVSNELKDSPTKTINIECGRDSNGPIYEDVIVFTNNKLALELLPPTEGFFFGSYEIDEWYKKDVDNLVIELEEVIKEMDLDEENMTWTDWFYTSSW